MADPSGPVLTLYSRTWCHLCDDMRSGLQALQSGLAFELTVIDVDSDPALEHRFGEWVPVLMHGDRELCHYHLDSAAVTDYLQKIR
jgi:thioredoxin reductase (NADPH)